MEYLDNFADWAFENPVKMGAACGILGGGLAGLGLVVLVIAGSF